MEGQVVYSASKGGVICFTKALAREMARHKICVNSVSPGLTDTEPLRATLDRMKEPVEDFLKRRVPFRRIGRPEEIAAAVVFLASDDADYITGQIISVNGGMFTG
ncbi:SDR family oxidoreductase [Thermodesulfobacteriota bacterium]